MDKLEELYKELDDYQEKHCPYQSHELDFDACCGCLDIGCIRINEKIEKYKEYLRRIKIKNIEN